MDLDSAVTFLESYLDAEWTLTRAVYTEPDDAAVAAARAEAERFLRPAPGTMLGVLPDRMPNTPAGEIASRAARLDAMTRRTLFLVTEHANPLRGRVFGGIAGYMSQTSKGSYERLFYVAESDGQPAIVSHYDVDPLASPIAWLHTGGEVIDQPGPVVAVRALAEPVRAAHREHWAAMTAAS